MTELAEHWRRWIGRSKEISDQIEPMRACAMQATLDDPGKTLEAGDGLPPLWHWLYFWEPEAHAALGPDGMAARGEFLPPINLEQRMFAGARVKFVKPVIIGQPAKRRSRVAKIERKKGRSGPLVFVTLQHETADAQGTCIQEEQDLVFRAPTPGQHPPAGERAPAVTPWRQQIKPDPLMLFRYSALTFNGHRVHYQHSYATEEEGYPGLVVHGSLLATLMVGLVRKHLPEAKMTWFECRAKRPIYDTSPFTVGGRKAADEKSAELWVTDASGYLAVLGRAQVA